LPTGNSETQRNIVRFEAASEDLRVGKFSGAVGTFAHLSPELEEKILRPAGIETLLPFLHRSFSATATHTISRRWP